MNDQTLPLTKTVEAIYTTDDPVPEYVAGNPLIDALPPILTDKEIIRDLSIRPAFNESERNLNNEVRIIFIRRLHWQFFQPLSQHVILWSHLSSCIREGYFRRNPLLQSSSEVANELYAAAKEKRPPSVPHTYIGKTFGFAVIGVSGVGKSTTIERMLEKFPQVIQHHEYKGNLLEMKQIVWIKLDCSHNGSERGFCLSFLNKVDQLVGTDYFNTNKKRSNTDSLLEDMQIIAHNYSLGVLLVDEVQHLANASQDNKKLLKFLVTLENTIGVPVILLGTPGAFPLLQDAFRAARRSCDYGYISWNPLEWDKSISNSEWEMFLSRMWKYQWIRNPAPFSANFAESMYEETQGIVALAVVLFILLQEEAIRSGTESISPEDAKRIARKHMAIIQPMMDALRSKDQKKIARYSDIVSIYVDDLQTSAKEAINTFSARTPFQENVESIVTYMCEMGIRPEEAEIFAEETVRNYPKDSLMVQVRKALILYESGKTGEEQNEVNKADKDKNDMRNYDSYQAIKNSSEEND